MQDDQKPEISATDPQNKLDENAAVAPAQPEREKDNRSDAFRAMKKLGRSRKR